MDYAKYIVIIIIIANIKFKIYAMHPESQVVARELGTKYQK